MPLIDRLVQLRSQCGGSSATAPDNKDGRLISERLQRLALPSPPAQRTKAIDEEAVARRLGGQVLTPGLIVVDGKLPLTEVAEAEFDDTGHSYLRLLANADKLRLGDLVFFDTETTGLSGGTGTLAFLLGMARIEYRQVVIRQWFLTGFKAEPALLAEANAWLTSDSHLVSFNGKSFDVPLLCTRFRLANLSTTLSTLPHFDLLHPLRRAFGNQWPDCRLQTAEQQLLKLYRQDDLPGYLVPEIWTRFVRTGSLQHIPAILQHNRQDLLSLVSLLIPLSRTYFQPGYVQADSFAIARHLQQRRFHGLALQHLQHHVAQLEPNALLSLADLYRRCQAWTEALSIWRRLANEGHPIAIERLAIYHEHRDRDYHAALHWTEHLISRQGDSPHHQQRKTRLLARIDNR